VVFAAMAKRRPAIGASIIVRVARCDLIVITGSV
jgi:hypothetical protein